MRGFRPDDLFHLRLTRDVALAPDGLEAAYALIEADPRLDGYRSRIWRIGPGSAARPITSGPSDLRPAYAPDGRELAFLRRTGDLAQLYVLPLAGGEAEPFTMLPGGVLDYAWSPGGRQIAVVTRSGPDGPNAWAERVEDRRARAAAGLLRRQAGPGAPPRPGLRRTLLLFGRDGSWRRLSGSDEDVFDPAFSPSGREVVYCSEPAGMPMRRDLRLVPSGGGEARPLTQGQILAGHPAFAPDGASICCIGHPPGGLLHQDAIWRVDPQGGAPQRLSGDVAVGQRATLDNSGAAGGGRLQFGADARSVFCLVSREGAVQLAEVSLQDGALRLCSGEEETVTEFSVDRRGAHRAIVRSDPRTPPEVVVRDSVGRTLARSDHNRFFAADVLLVGPDRLKAPTPAGPAVDTFVYRPAAPAHPPVLLMLHGGPDAMFAAVMSRTAQALCGAGFAVVCPNPRGSAGYGSAFLSAVAEDYGGVDLGDALAALDAALGRFPELDGGRLGVLGSSYGGFLAQLLLCSPRFAAGASLRGFSDLAGHLAARSAREPLSPGPGGRYRLLRLLRRSPLAKADAMRAPLLLLHGAEDRRCPLSEAEAMFAALEGHGLSAELVRFPGEGHDIETRGRPWHRVLLLEELIGFFRRYLAQ